MGVKGICYESSPRMIQVSGSDDGVADSESACVVGVLMSSQSLLS